MGVVGVSVCELALRPTEVLVVLVLGVTPQGKEAPLELDEIFRKSATAHSKESAKPLCLHAVRQ